MFKVPPKTAESQTPVDNSKKRMEPETTSGPAEVKPQSSPAKDESSSKP
jgi:hypothetical protein